MFISKQTNLNIVYYHFIILTQLKQTFQCFVYLFHKLLLKRLLNNPIPGLQVTKSECI